MLTDSPKVKNYRLKKRDLKDTRKWYSDSQKLEAVKLWLVCGNLSHTAAALNLPLPTIRNWRYSEWWKELVEELKAEENIQLNNRLRAIAEKSMTVLEDRLENGDWILDRSTNSLIRKPVNLRDSTLAFNSLHDRRTKLLEKKEEKQDNKAVIDRLAALASKFEEIANKRQPLQVTDVQFVETTDAIHDQREERLSEGTLLGKEEQAQQSKGQSPA